MRLTEKCKVREHYRDMQFRPANFHTSIECYNKLGQLEDIEEELGIDLVTLFKALDEKQRIFALNEYDLRVVELPVLYASRKLVDGEIFINVNGCFANFKTKDYGKWWALTKEELL